MDLTFASEKRLKTKIEIDNVFSRKWSASAAQLVVYGLPNEMQFNRLGIVIGRKYGNAVARNRFKRVCREAFRLTQSVQPSGWDWLVLPFSRTKTKRKVKPPKLILWDVKEELLSNMFRISERSKHGQR